MRNKRLPNTAMLARNVIILLLTARCLLATQGGFVAGVVRDRSGAVLPAAEVQIQSEATGARQKIYCDDQGRYSSAELSPGIYKLTARSRGFRTVARHGLSVKAGQTSIIDFVMELIPLQQEVTVQSARDGSDPAGNGLAIGRESTTNTFPANGRDLHAFYAMVPGSVVTPLPPAMEANSPSMASGPILTPSAWMVSTVMPALVFLPCQEHIRAQVCRQ